MIKGSYVTGNRERATHLQIDAVRSQRCLHSIFKIQLRLIKVQRCCDGVFEVLSPIFRVVVDPSVIFIAT